jgi:hypothetical protein
MPPFTHKIIFDTSAINALEADKDLVAITQSISVAYRIGLPETTLSEVIACPEEPKRKRLLEVCKRLLQSGHCIMPFQWGRRRNRTARSHSLAERRDPGEPPGMGKAISENL